MLTDADRREFADLLDVTCEYYGRDAFSLAVKRMWWDDLKHLPMTVIRGAFDAHRRSPGGKFAPKSADILAAIAQAQAAVDGHLSSDEAWAIAVGATDEASSVVWTDQMAAAFLGAALPLIERGDHVAARKAFQSRYDDEVTAARAKGVRAQWKPSLGTNPETRFIAIEQAVLAGRLTREHAAALLPAPITPAGAELLALAKAALRPLPAPESEAVR